MNDHYIYVFIRQDLTIAEQLVHLGHVAYHTGNMIDEMDGIPNLIVVGLPHAAAVLKCIKKLFFHNIQHQTWHDPDTSYGITAIATVPLTPEEKVVLANYRLWSLPRSPEKDLVSATMTG